MEGFQVSYSIHCASKTCSKKRDVGRLKTRSRDRPCHASGRAAAATVAVACRVYVETRTTRIQRGKSRNKEAASQEVAWVDSTMYCRNMAQMSQRHGGGRRVDE